MPIIVDEVVIQVEVTNADKGAAKPTKSAPAGRREIVAECVERVLEILAQRSER